MERGEGLRAIVPGHPSTPDLWLEIDPLVPLPDDPVAWLRGVVERDAPGPVTVLESREATTELGWPLQVMHAVVGEPGGRAVEQRLAAFYQFLDFAGSVLVRGSGVARYEAHRLPIIELLGKARPEFAGAEPVALADVLR
jgi:hypothetical protein